MNTERVYFTIPFYYTHKPVTESRVLEDSTEPLNPPKLFCGGPNLTWYDVCVHEMVTDSGKVSEMAEQMILQDLADSMWLQLAPELYIQ